MNSRIQRSPAVKRAAAEYLGERPGALVTVNCRQTGSGPVRVCTCNLPSAQATHVRQPLQYTQSSRVHSCKGLHMYSCSHLCPVKPVMVLLPFLILRRPPACMFSVHLAAAAPVAVAVLCAVGPSAT